MKTNLSKNMSVADVTNFVENLSNVIHDEHQFKLKPIKLLHAVSKAFGFKNWNAYRANLEVPVHADTAIDKPFKDMIEGLTPIENIRAVVGRSGSGKSSMIAGEVINEVLGRESHSKVIVVDSGYSYEKLAKSLGDKATFSELFPQGMDLTNVAKTKLNVFEIETMRVIPMEEANRICAGMLIETIKRISDRDTIMYLDEVSMLPSEFLVWALTEFSGELVVIIQHTQKYTFERGLFKRFTHIQ